MPKKVAPPKLTGGGGFVFEDDVAAYFLSCLLSGQPPLCPGLGFLTRIDFQTRADGWLLDDVLLTVTSLGAVTRCAFSVKSDRQFTSRSAPLGFVTAAWEQLLQDTTEIFNTERDRLGIITAPLPASLSESVGRLISFASKQEVKLLGQRAAVKGFMSRRQSELFSSFECPAELRAKYQKDRTHTGEVLKRLIHLEFDFERQSSSRQKEAVKNCREALESNSLDEALNLWKELRTIGQSYRPKAGFIDFPGLVYLLRLKFRLKNFPEHQPDWARLLDITSSNLSVIPDKIGNTVSIPRNEDRKKLADELGKSRAVVIRGPSGCGKTVLAKLWTQDALLSNKVLWFDARSFEASDLASFEGHLGLTNRLRDIIRYTTSPGTFLAIDGIDRVFLDHGFRTLAILLQYLELHLETSSWRLLLSVQPEEWDRIQMMLARMNVSTAGWQIIDIQEPSELDLMPVCDAFPSLRQLLLQQHLKKLLLKPKVLDLLTTQVHLSAVDTSKWVGESDLIKWFWETEVVNRSDGLARAGFLKVMAEIQGDELR